MIEKYSLYDKLTYGFYNTLVLGMASGLIAKLDTEIQPAEVVHWSWRGMQQSLGKSVLSGLCSGLVLWLIFRVHGQPYPMLFGLLIGLVCGLLIGMSGGLSHKMLDEQNLSIPNQGIRHSLQNGISLGLISGSIGGVFLGIVSAIAGGPMNGIVYGLVAGVGMTVIIGFRAGILACIQHYTLRVLLWHSGALPLNLTAFLDYCAEHILLSKVGGGYVFVHRLLLEYFVDIEAGATPSANISPTQSPHPEP